MTTNKVYIAFDFGTKRIGTAVGQTITGTATPIATLRAQNGEPNWDDIKKLIKEWRPHAFIVGIPVMMDGTEQPVTRMAKIFRDKLGEQTGLVVHSVDERLSTRAAKEAIFDLGGSKALRNTEIDSVAAKIILEQWLAQQIDHEEDE